MDVFRTVLDADVNIFVWLQVEAAAPGTTGRHVPRYREQVGGQRCGQLDNAWLRAPLDDEARVVEAGPACHRARAGAGRARRVLGLRDESRSHCGGNSSRGHVPNYLHRPHQSPRRSQGPLALVFSDHFPGTTLDTANWSTCYRWGCINGGNNELESYQASQVTVHSSTVSLTVVPKQIDGKPYVSGMLSSYGKFSYLYGYAQIVAKLPVGQGLWSSFWFEPANGTWPPEVDILENWAQSHSVVSMSTSVPLTASIQRTSTCQPPRARSTPTEWTGNREPSRGTWTGSW